MCYASRMLRMVGAEVAGPTPAEFNGLAVERWPLVSWSPSFAQARFRLSCWPQTRTGQPCTSSMFQPFEVSSDMHAALASTMTQHMNTGHGAERSVE